MAHYQQSMSDRLLSGFLVLDPFRYRELTKLGHGSKVHIRSIVLVRYGCTRYILVTVEAFLIYTHWSDTRRQITPKPDRWH